MKRLSLMFLFALLATAPLSAQWLGSLSMYSAYDDNAFSNSSALPSGLSTLSLQLGYFDTRGIWAVNYTGDLNNYLAFPDRQFSAHTAGISLRVPYNDDSYDQVTALLTGSARFDKQSFEVYDYGQALGRLEIRHRFSDILRSRAGYYARYRSYPNYNELSYLEHVTWLSGSSYLPSRTSITAQVEFGFKNYLASSTPTATPLSASPGMTETLILDGGDGGGNGNGGNGGGSGNSGNGGTSGGGNGGGSGDGEGSGNGSGQQGGQGSGGMGNGLSEAGLTSGADPTTIYLLYEEPSTSQIRAWINIGQSLANGTGISLRYLQRWNLTNRGRAFVGGSVDFIGEEELFDDPYSYESNEFLLRLTQLLPLSAELQIAAFFYLKHYPYPSTLEYASGTADLREDGRYGGWISLSKTIPGSWLLFSGVRISLQYTYTRNESNTVYYDYRSNYLGLGLSTDF